jgi:predicted amidohydrolase YtcJ
MAGKSGGVSPRSWLWGAWLAGLSVAAACARRPEPADFVLRRGRIVTLDEAQPTAEALAARAGRIIAVGSNSQVERYIGPATRVLDIPGLVAIPGLIEGHGHFMRFGDVLMQLDLRHARTWDEIVTKVGQAAARAAPDAWIVGWGWHQDKWDRPPQPTVEGLPTHERLSAASPHNPVFLSHSSGHGVFVNARAMEIAGITPASRDPVGGEIVRDGRGTPIGMLREGAAQPVRDALARARAARPSAVIEAEARQKVKLAAEASLASGITSFQDMGSSFQTIDLLKKLAEEGALPIRLYLAVEETADVMKDRLAAYRMVDHRGYLTVRAIGEKVLDGALGTHGGWLLEPYSDLPRSSGFNVTPVEEIRRSADLALRHDYQMAIQGIGDRAARVLFDLYEAAFRAHPGRTDRRWRIEHAQVIHPADMPRWKALGVIPGIQGIFPCSDGPWVAERLGWRRVRERGYQFRSMVDSGAVVMNGTDPPVEEIDPIASFACAVTRKLPDGSVFLPEQRLTRMQALRAYTWGNAYAAFEEASKGSLATGKLADITVLSKDLLSVPEAEIRSTRVMYTIVGGQVRYQSRMRTSSEPAKGGKAKTTR